MGEQRGERRQRRQRRGRGEGRADAEGGDGGGGGQDETAQHVDSKVVGNHAGRRRGPAPHLSNAAPAAALRNRKPLPCAPDA
ncbi:hypothetical protein GCM10010249_33920 [Streptomyces roseolilacinus]|uniref:Uncharacterized protein n=1 Tax=Streptomyces roseolilacinus TaxID=66904 RepID=A0A918B119_9ACTN|nr:hypothetical protein GCM10010249_33920 [Streptomyces roseolilacinus]